MASGIKTYIDILGSNAGAQAAISALTTLDATVKKNDASIKTLEKSYNDAQAAATKAFAEGDKKGASKAAREAAQIQSEIGKRAKQNAAAEAAAGSVVTKSKATEAAMQRAATAEKTKDATVAAKAAAQQRKDSIAQARDHAAMVKIQRGLVEAPKAAKSEFAELAAKAASANGPLGSVVSTIQNLGQGGKAGVVIAIAAALIGVAVAGAYAAAEVTRFAIGAADAARSSRLLSEAALGAAAAGNELEQVVDQMSNLAPGLSAKLKDVGRSLSDVGIVGRDAQRTLNTFGIVATARGEQAAGAIRSVAESSRVAGRLMLGPLNRITGEFDSLRGTGIRSADVFKALSTVTGKSAAAFKDARTAGLVPFKDGLKALELAAQTALGGVVAKQAMSLTTQLEKLRENVSKLFSGVAIETFLAGLKTVTDLFDQNTVTGYVLREVFTAVFTKIAALAALAFPYIVAGIKGAVFGVIIFATAAKQAYKAITEFVGTGNKVDNIALAFKVGVGIVAAFVGSIVALTAAFVLLGAVAVIALAPIWVPIAITAAVIYGAIKAIGAFIDAISSIGDTIAKTNLAASASKMIDGLIKGIKSRIADVKSAVLEVSGAITSAFDSDQEIQSPGKKPMRQGRDVVRGHALGMEQSVPLVMRSTMKVSGAVTSGLAASEQGAPGQPVSANERPTFSFTDCVFGSMTQAQWEEMATTWYLKQSRGNPVTR